MDPISGCTETGSGLTVLGSGGGCIGYGGIDNGVALELDPYPDTPYDPVQETGGYYYEDNHIALQGCGPGSQISISHETTTNCLITLGSGTGATTTLITSPITSAVPPAVGSAVTLADGNPHQIVIVYNGPNDVPANYLYVYLDPAFNPGTHTPVAGSTPLFSGPFDIANYISLSNGNAYIGFTAATGFSYEQHELMGFTFNPHILINPNYTLAASTAGSGSGMLLGTNCSTGSYPPGTTVTCAAKPVSGSQFTGWSGGTCSGSGSCSFSLSSNSTVIANFSTAYTLTVTEVGTGSGSVTDGSQITCSIANESVTGTCAGSYSTGVSVTLTAAAAANSTFAGWGGACVSAGASPTCNVLVNQAANAIATFNPQNFGNVNVCPAGQSSQAPCSQTLTLTYTMAASTNLGATQVVTQGATGLDFALGGGGTCTGSIPAGNSCTVNVTFTPLAPGLRLGAVRLFDNNGNPIANSPIYGVGQGPVVAFSPSTQAPVGTGSYTLSTPKGVLVDAAGNLFISDTGEVSGIHQVLKITPSGAISTVGFGLMFPQGMAEDGAGDLFIADNNLNQVVEVPAGCTTSSCQLNVPNPLSLSSQLGVAVDGAGDLFIGDFEENKVAEVPANGGPQTLVYNPTPGCGTPSGCSHPVDLTTDAAGDLFVADYGLKTVAEVPAGCTVAGCQKTIGTGWSQPDGVAVDAAGDVFVADAGLDEVVEVPAGCAASGCQAVLVSGVDTVAVKLDATGDLVVDNLVTKEIFEIARSQPPSLSFALANVGSLSADSPKLVSVQNVGNQPLTGSVALSSLGANFATNGSSTCGTSFSLAPGATCSESFGFMPQSTGVFTGTVDFNDNNLNLSSLVGLQAVSLSGTGGLNGQPVGAVVPNVIGMTQAAGTTTITGAGLSLGSLSSEYSDSEPAGSVIGENPTAGSQVNLGTAVQLLISTGQAPPPPANPLIFENNYFVTGDFAAAGVTLHGRGVGGVATGTITIPDSTTSPGSQGVPDGADIVDGFLYWTTLENTPAPSANTGTFLGYPITGQQVGTDVSYTDGGSSGTLRVYRADVNNYFQDVPSWNGARLGSGAFTVSLPDSGGSGYPITEGASLVVIYRVLSPNFPLKSVVIYDGSATPATSTSQSVQGFYDALGTGGEIATLSYGSGSWSSNPSSVSLTSHASQYTSTMNPGNAYAAVILSTPVTNSDNDGILDAWKTGPAPSDFFAGQPGYYDVKTQSWVGLPGAKHGEKDLFVQLDYMCGNVTNGVCSGENLFPSPDPDGNDPLAMVQQAFQQTGIVLHLEIGNAVAETTCTDSPGQLCQFPGEPGVIGWKNSLEFSKVWPRNLDSCASGGDCTALSLRAEGQLSLRAVRPLPGDTGMELALRIIDLDHGQQWNHDHRHH